jgi:hypothetical protein
LEPTLPATIKAVTKGAKARIKAMPTSEGSHEVAPNASKDGLDWFVKTMPVTKPVSETKLRDLMPTW